MKLAGDHPVRLLCRALNCPRAGLYRASSTASGEADQLQSPEGEAIYRACSSEGHHHHLICRSCGTTVEIQATDVETWAQRTAAAHGFTRAEHVVDRRAGHHWGP